MHPNCVGIPNRTFEVHIANERIPVPGPQRHIPLNINAKSCVTVSAVRKIIHEQNLQIEIGIGGNFSKQRRLILYRMADQINEF